MDKREEELFKLSREGFNPLTMSPEELKRFSENIKGLQIQFQMEYCKACEHYDKEKEDFKNVGHPNNPLDCINHYTDIVGDCWNYTDYAAMEQGHPEKRTITNVYGKRVRLKGAYFSPEHGFVKAIRDDDVEGFSISDDLPTSTFIKGGELGTIAEGRYCSGVFDYSIEWPVQFDKFKAGIPGYDKDFSIGIPHEALEFLDV